MIEKIKIPIENIIMKKENVLEIAEYLFKQENKKNVSYRIKFKNEQEIEGDDIEIFKNRKFEEYEIKMIHMNYMSKDFNDKIEIYIYNNDTIGMSGIEITSNNAAWLAVTEKDINNYISYCDKQNKINIIFKNISLSFILMIVITIISTILIVVFITKISDIGEEALVSIMSLCFVVFLFINMKILEILEETFPRVEISINDKNNTSKKKRMNIIWIFSSIVLPIILNIVYDLFKYIGNKGV